MARLSKKQIERLIEEHKEYIEYLETSITNNIEEINTDYKFNIEDLEMEQTNVCVNCGKIISEFDNFCSKECEDKFEIYINNSAREE